jgi:hypothetical protein
MFQRIVFVADDFDLPEAWIKIIAGSGKSLVSLMI